MKFPLAIRPRQNINFISLKWHSTCKLPNHSFVTNTIKILIHTMAKWQTGGQIRQKYKETSNLM